MDELPSLATFLAGIDFMKNTYGERITLILTADSPGLSLLQLDKFQAAENGVLPDMGLGDVPLLSSMRSDPRGAE